MNWSIPIILELYRTEINGPRKGKRFIELSKIFISTRSKVQLKRLKELEKENIIFRGMFNEVPLRVEYSLTEKVLDLCFKLQELII